LEFEKIKKRDGKKKGESGDPNQYVEEKNPRFRREHKKRLKYSFSGNLGDAK